MRLLLDSGILLRATYPTHPQFPMISAGVRRLGRDGHTFVSAVQNIAEFWNVCTRPGGVRGGFGMTIAETTRRLANVEELVEVVTETPASYVEWRQLIVQHGVSGVQVHDARLVAVMRVERIPGLLTLNAKDFTRYPGLVVLTPEQVMATGGPAVSP